MAASILRERETYFMVINDSARPYCGNPVDALASAVSTARYWPLYTASPTVIHTRTIRPVLFFSFILFLFSNSVHSYSLFSSLFSFFLTFLHSLFISPVAL